MSSPDSSPLKVGVLLFSVGVQLLDLSAIDFLGMATPEYLKVGGLPENVVAGGRAFEFRYILDVVKGDGPLPTDAPLTSSVNVRVTDTLDTIDKLDILFIPGPPPSYTPSPATSAFIRKQSQTALAVLVVCSGILPVAFSGILAGKRATAPLALLPTLREKAPEVKWVAKRWTVDVYEFQGAQKGKGKGQVWTSGAVMNGTDMMAAFVREFVPGVGDLVCKLADSPDRGDEYSEEQLKMKFF